MSLQTMTTPGRPTKYNEEILIKAQDYLINYENYGDVVPTISGLSLVLDITRETLNQWSKAEDKQDFSDTLKKIIQKQENELIMKGLSSDFNSTITKLMLANHGYSERTQQEISGPNGGPVQTENKWQIEFVNAETPDTKET